MSYELLRYVGDLAARFFGLCDEGLSVVDEVVSYCLEVVCAIPLYRSWGISFGFTC